MAVEVRMNDGAWVAFLCEDPPGPLALLLSWFLGSSGPPLLAKGESPDEENIFLRFWLFFKFSVRSVRTSLKVFVASFSLVLKLSTTVVEWALLCLL